MLARALGMGRGNGDVISRRSLTGSNGGSREARYVSRRVVVFARKTGTNKRRNLAGKNQRIGRTRRRARIQRRSACARRKGGILEFAQAWRHALRELVVQGVFFHERQNLANPT